MASSGTGRGNDAIPKWAESLIASQKELISKMSAIITPGGTGEDEPVKKTRPKKPSLPRYDDSDEFDARFGHLFERGVYDSEEEAQDDIVGEQDDDQMEDQGDTDEENNNEENNNDDGKPPGRDEMSDEAGSEDDDLIRAVEKEPNWKVGQKIKKFIEDVIDVPLPEEVQKQLDDEFVPSEDLEKFFVAPKMPHRLYKAISRLTSKCSIKTERALYASQTEAFVLTKPLLASLIELKPLGKQVSNTRRMISKSIHGIYSISLKISKARRENVRHLFKEQLADVLYGYEPNHVSLFGGTDFASQVEKAAKVAKLDFSWAKKRGYTQAFHSRGSQGFRGSRGGYQRSNFYETARGRQNYGRQGASKAYGFKKTPKRGRGAPKKSQ